ncbi:hypothetical protein CDAR_262351 [Caerostris darwini]|uniref:Uncharacterized protein n=1 Tax=Caerostris darwini TaxID=1538125 RepID=A0AAV4QB83_9ARAC|nr:hypothetical protein CDAR_262351 [Caerostris darwini]
MEEHFGLWAYPSELFDLAILVGFEPIYSAVKQLKWLASFSLIVPIELGEEFFKGGESQGTTSHSAGIEGLLSNRDLLSVSLSGRANFTEMYASCASGIELERHGSAAVLDRQCRSK